MGQSDPAKHKSQKHKKLMLIRYGRMGNFGWFEHNEDNIPKIDPYAVVKTARGLELGTVVGQFSYKAGQFKSSPEQVEKYYYNRTKDYPLAQGGTFVRFATKEDLIEAEHLDASAREELKCCQKFVAELGLDMKTVEAEHLFGGERIVLYFTSNGRVDFRDLVRKLAKEYQTRIEMRQIGSRDEARIIGGFESCGQQCCCTRFLKILEPVNMRMAKLQKATLDPSKISGHCGRLKCCLRYEDDIYKELKVNLPRKNALVETPAGQGKVIDTQILTQLVVVQFESGKREAFGLEDITVIDKKTGTAENKSKDKKYKTITKEHGAAPWKNTKAPEDVIDDKQTENEKPDEAPRSEKNIQNNTDNNNKDDENNNNLQG